MVVIVISYIVTVAVHRPKEVFFEPVRMAMIVGHFQMILDRLKNRWCVRE
ncbi:hypothetical protein [Ruegeria atlantica]|nr:hypothetical protein [Ruegeria atlantica]